jgi:hypothetical protein
MRRADSVGSIFILLLRLVLPSGPALAGVVINEVLYDPEGADTGLEFVEVMNCGHAGVSLTGWTLETGNGASPGDWTVEWIGDDLDYLEPGDILLIGESGVAPEPDYVTALDLQNGPDGVRLSDGNSVVDVVGWGEPLFPEYCEGLPAADVGSGHSLARSPDCFDHGDNATDFIDCAAPTPGSRNSLAYDLALRLRHAGAVVLPESEPVEVEFVVTNVGALPVEPGAPTVELLVDGSAGAEISVVVAAGLAPRDSAVVRTSWEASAGYHRIAARLVFEPDGERSNNSAETSVTVGTVGALVAVNEVMHSPIDASTEWAELVELTGDTLSLAGWRLGDGSDLFALEAAGGGPASIGPGDFLVVADDPEALSGVASAPVVTTDGWETLSAGDLVILTDGHGTPIDIVPYERSWGGGKGVSLERVRPDLPAEDPANWGSSVAPEGSTPGRTNSIHLPQAPAAGSIAIAPNPFSPDGDGECDRTVIRLDLPVPRATARITVFDMDGYLRAVIADHADVASSSEFVWDGSADDGSLLPSGLYIVYAEAIAASRGVFVSAKAPVGVVRR